MNKLPLTEKEKEVLNRFRNLPEDQKEKAYKIFKRAFDEKIIVRVKGCSKRRNKGVK